MPELRKVDQCNIDMISTRKKNAQRAIAIIREIKAEVDEKLSHLFDGLAANVADALFEEMRDLDEKEALEHHFNVMRALKVQSVAYRKEFDRLMNDTWRIFLRSRDIPIAETPRGIAGTLIDSYRRKIESSHKMLLNDIRLRLSCLLKSELDAYPLRPEILYLCFWQSIEQLDLNYDERVLLLPLFHRFVMDRYGQVLGVVNRTLIEHAVGTRKDDP